jgi:hypothetical protein
MSYTRLALPDDTVTPIDRELQAGNFTDMFSDRNSFRDVLSRYRAAVRTPDEYDVTGNVANAINVLNANINLVDAAMRNCYLNSSNCVRPTNYQDVNAVARVSLRAKYNPCLKLKPLCEADVWTDELYEAQEACVALGGRAINLNTCNY